MKLSRPWLLPFVPFYYLGSLFLKKMYDLEIWESTTYDLPIITIGNISVGGTGKSPFVMYLLEHFSEKYKLATLSRGYGRNTNNFQLLKKTSIASEVGDEPLQFKQNFVDVVVAVDADRRNGIRELQSLAPDIDAIILDDAFQHRKVQGGLQIVLTPYAKLYTEDMSLPAGDLREPKSAAQRADIIIVTKCPLNVSKKEQLNIEEKLRLKKKQHLFFVGINYASSVKTNDRAMLLETFILEPFTLLTGIANPSPLIEYLENKGAKFEHLSFLDHHNYTAKQMEGFSKKERILTTEKDFMRLKDVKALSDTLFYLPIEIKFLEKEVTFLNQVQSFIEK